jgi:SAM-dependent methyltransferase
VDKLARFVGFDPSTQHSVEEDLTDLVASVLNFEASHEGFSSQRGLWFNPPVGVAYESGDVHLRWVNERVVEAPYVFRALGAVQPDAKVLDVGATESTVCLSLATLGYHVTAIDPRPNPLVHERLEVVVGTVEDWETEERFDAIVCLSTIEHLGTGAYEQETAERRVDLEAMKRLHELTRDGGLLVLTTAVGPASVDEFGRVYDREGLDRLLEGWKVDDVTLVQRKDPTTWVLVDTQIEDLTAEDETVAMVTATKIA